MKIDLNISGTHAGGLSPRMPLARAWRLHSTVWGGAMLLVLGLFHRDVAHLVSRWWNSDTYGHCLLIPPIIAWLVWQRRAGLLQLAPRAWAPGLVLVIGAGLVWLLGELAGVALLRHAALVFLLQASVPTLFGPAVARANAFPLFFALFMIPAGEELVPPMQHFTARFCIWMLDLFEVPAYLDGVFISIPNGEFEVAEACSGVRFLIAMIAFGALASNICFKSWGRRILFMSAAILLPIVANGFRAWGTIYIAHLTTPEFARGVDHVIYGWIFFAFVMALLMAAGWRFFDRPAGDGFIDPSRLQRPGTSPGRPGRLAGVAAAFVAVAGLAPAYAAYADARVPAAATGGIALQAPAGWRETAYAGYPWKPQYQGATATAFRSFADREGRVVDVYVAMFDRQDEGHELVGYGQGVLPPESEWAWAANGSKLDAARTFQINNGPVVREVAQAYWVNGRLVADEHAAKLEGLKAKLLGGPTRAATIVLSSERPDVLVSDRPLLARFAAAAGPLDLWLTRSLVAADAPSRSAAEVAR